MENLVVTVSEQVKTVMALYEAFGRGDIPYIVSRVTDDFVWTVPNDPGKVPHGGRYVGRAEFPRFFENLAGHTLTTAFEVNELAQGENLVIALGKHSVRALKTGRELTFDWAMAWHFRGEMPCMGQAYYSTAEAEKIYH